MSERASKVSKRVATPKPGDDSGAAQKPARSTGAQRAAAVNNGPKTGSQTRPPAAGGDPAGKTQRNKRPPKTGRTTQKQKSVKREEQELEPITNFPRGISLGVKLAAFTAAVVAAFMAFQGMLTFSIASTRMNEQITEQGVSLANTLGQAVDRSFWVAPPEPPEPPAPKPDPDDPNPAPKPPTRPKGMSRGELRADWDRRLQGIVESSGNKILSVIILEKTADGKNPQGVSQYPATALAFNRISSQPSIGEVSIVDGTLDGKRVRVFDRPISLGLDLDDEIDRKTAELQRLEDAQAPEPQRVPLVLDLRKLTGLKDLVSAAEVVAWRETHLRPTRVGDPRFVPSVSVFVNASMLDQVKEELWHRIAAVTLCGALAGVLLTVLISAVLTNPVRTLENDLRVVAGGDLSHQTPILSRDEIGSLAHVFNIMTRNLQTAQNNAAERKSFERELSICKEIQEKLLPERIPAIPGYDIQSHYRSAKEVGGDYYDFIVIDQTHLGIIVADVAGKGVPGAMVMTMARSLVRLASVRNVSPADTFKKVNRILAKDIRRGMFVTAAYMVLNVKTRKLKVASAGHNPVVLFRAATGELELLKPNGIALGFDKGTIFDNHIKEVEVQLETGDRIVSYTDGVNEAMDAAGEEFGDDKFHAVVKESSRKTSKEFVEAIVKALDGHRAGAEQSDDITITTLAVTEAAGGAAQVVAEAEPTSDEPGEAPDGGGGDA